MLLRSGMVRAFRRGKAEWGKVVGTANRVCTKAVRVRGDAKRSDLLGDRRGGWCGELAPVRDNRAWRSRVGQGPTGAEKPLDMMKFTGTLQHVEASRPVGPAPRDSSMRVCRAPPPAHSTTHLYDPQANPTALHRP